MCVLATTLADGSPHASAMHFVYDTDVLIFSTHFGNRKLSGLDIGHTAVSVAVGFSEQDWITLQLDGHIEKMEASFAKKLILSKYPESEKHMDDKTIFLKFTPAWWRYTDFKTTPPTILSNS